MFQVRALEAEQRLKMQEPNDKQLDEVLEILKEKAKDLSPDELEKEIQKVTWELMLSRMFRI